MIDCYVDQRDLHSFPTRRSSDLGDIERARDVLRAKGQAGAEKRAGRAAAEGVVAAAGSSRSAALIELNCETDFVARNPEFLDRKSTRLNSSHVSISYAVFCLKKK